MFDIVSFYEKNLGKKRVNRIFKLAHHALAMRVLDRMFNDSPKNSKNYMSFRGTFVYGSGGGRQVLATHPSFDDDFDGENNIDRGL